MRASRLLSLLLTLQARGRVTASEMAAEFEVSERTIYRDIDHLSAARIPVIADRGRAGGFRLADGYRTQLTGLSDGEAEALLLAGLPAAVADLGLAEVMATARTKLMAALPAGARADRVAARFHLDASGWFHATDDVEALPQIARAVWGSHQISFRYRRRVESGRRTVGPLGVVLKGGIWYVVALRGAELRTYRVGRMSDVRTLDTPFDRPRGFDLAEWWRRSAREFESGSYPATAVIRLSPRGQELLELLGPYVQSAAAKSLNRADRHGWRRCTIPVESIEFGIRELLRLGTEVEVLSPEELREGMRRTLANVALLYRRVRR
jgi:predicted DNA-binding transcriptional regulator YafY